MQTKEIKVKYGAADTEHPERKIWGVEIILPNGNTTRVEGNAVSEMHATEEALVFLAWYFSRISFTLADIG